MFEGCDGENRNVRFRLGDGNERNEVDGRRELTDVFGRLELMDGLERLIDGADRLIEVLGRLELMDGVRFRVIDRNRLDVRFCRTLFDLGAERGTVEDLRLI